MIIKLAITILFFCFNHSFAQENTLAVDTNEVDIIQASKNGDIDRVVELLESGIDINYQDKHGQTVLMSAAGNSDSELISYLSKISDFQPDLQIDEIDPNVQDMRGRNALMIASSKGTYNSVYTLMATYQNLDVRAVDNYNTTALMLASSEGRQDIVDLLLQHPGVDADKKDTDGYTALMLASINGHTDVISSLLTSGRADVNADNLFGYTALMFASMNNHMQVVQTILDVSTDNVDINAKNSWGQPAYNLAVMNGHTKVMDILQGIPNIDLDVTTKLDEDVVVDPNLMDKAKIDNLLQASASGYIDVFESMFAKRDTDINARDSLGMTALMWASTKGDVTITDILLKTPYIGISYVNLNKQNAFMIACKNGHLDIVKMYNDNWLKRNANIRDIDRRNALTLAVIGGHTEVVEYLANKTEVDINVEDRYGIAALAYAYFGAYLYSSDYVEIAKILRSTGRIITD